MARINIEDELFKDNRFTKLCILFGSRRVAIGAIIEAWILAQQYVSPENPSARIPICDWLDQDIAPEIITSKLAKEVDGLWVEISGATEHFAWLVQKQLAAKKGGEAKAKRQNEAYPVVPEPAGAMPAEPGACPLTLSLTLSPSLIPDQTPDLSQNNNVDSKTETKPKRQRKPKPTGLFSAEIEAIYLAHYPRKEGKDKGIKSFNEQIKTREQLEQFEKATKNYREHTVGDELKHIKMFSSFASTWRDYIELPQKQIQAFNKNPANKASQVFDTARAQLEAIERGEL